MRVNSDNPNAPLSSSWERAPITWPVLLMIPDNGKTNRSQAPNNVLLAPLPPVDLPEQLVPRSFKSAFSQVQFGHFARPQSYRHSVGWANYPTCPDCPGDMWAAPLQVAQFLTCLNLEPPGWSTSSSCFHPFCYGGSALLYLTTITLNRRSEPSTYLCTFHDLQSENDGPNTIPIFFLMHPRPPGRHIGIDS